MELEEGLDNSSRARTSELNAMLENIDERSKRSGSEATFYDALGTIS